MKKPGLPTLLTILFFLALLAVGLSIYSSYGMSWDEPTQQELGMMNYRYAFKGDPALLRMRDRWYGPFFEIALVAFQSRGNAFQVYLSRHLLNFLVFFAGCLAFFLLGKRLTGSTWMGLLGAVSLVLSPRIFADSFYNSKDIPFLVIYIFSLLSLLWFLDRPAPWRWVVHAFLCAALISVRLPGLIILPLTLCGLLLEAICKRIPWKTTIASFAAYLVLTSALSILFWPALWPDPFNGFLTAFRFMSHFPHETEMLYLGERISSLALPWHYIPVWIAVSTPLSFLAGFVPGLIVIGWRQANSLANKYFIEQRDELLVAGAFFGPLLTVIALGSVLYDGWRQMFFIYPPMLLVMLTGLQAIKAWLDTHLPKPISMTTTLAALAIGLLPVAAWMVSNHPYQNLYFNILAGQDMQLIQQRFMLDYWGLTYRQGEEALLAQDPAPEINVFMQTEAGERTLGILPPDLAARVHVVHKLADADYYIGNYHLLKEPYPFKTEVFAVQVGNAKVLSVFRLSEEEKK